MEYKFVDIRQRHYKAFLVGLKQFKPDEWEDIYDLPVNLYYDVLCRSAVKAGWFEDSSITEEYVDDMIPKDLEPMAVAVAEVYSKVLMPDPN